MRIKMRTEDYNQSGIYQITNLYNNKIYIGSAYNFYNRFRTHKSTLDHQKHDNEHLQRAYVKYGADNFEFNIMEICDKSELEIKEEYYINKFFGSNCYNMNIRVSCRFMNDRFNRNYELISPQDNKITHYGNLKTLSKLLYELDSSSKESQYYNGLFQLVNHKRLHYKGWRLIENIDCDLSPLRKNNYKGKTYDVKILSPDGIEYTSITNLANFCREHDISSPATFSNVLTGKIKSYNGWYLSGIKPQKWNAKLHDVILESPNGDRYGPIENLTKFAKEHKLSQSGLRNFLIGKLKTYKNWKIIKPLENLK